MSVILQTLWRGNNRIFPLNNLLILNRCNQGNSDIWRVYWMRFSFYISFNGVRLRILHCKQLLDESCGIQVKCWLVDSYVLEDVGVMCALMVLCVTLYEASNLIIDKFVWIEDSGWCRRNTMWVNRVNVLKDDFPVQFLLSLVLVCFNL